MNHQLFEAIQQERLDQVAELRRDRRQREQEMNRKGRGTVPARRRKTAR